MGTVDRALDMRATESKRVAGNQSDGVPTAEQSIEFDARDRLLGRLDDIPVRRAAEEPAVVGGTPTPNALETTERRAL